MRWFLTLVSALGRSRRGAEYFLRLEREDGSAAAEAVVDVWLRSSPPGHWDPAVEVVTCDHAGAREWLAAPEHEYCVAEVTIDLHDDPNGHWLHVSVSRANRLPTWGDLVLVRDELGYADLSFVQLMPPRRAWLNVHSYCLHLKCRLDAPTVPESLWDHGDGAGYRAEGTVVGRRVT